MKIICSPSILSELSDKFSYQSNNSRYDKRVQYGMWDGKIRLVNKKTRTLYLGLQNDIIEFCKTNNYSLQNNIPKVKKLITYNEFEAFIKTINLPSDRVPYDYQIETCVNLINENGRGFFISPTACHKKDDLVFMANFTYKKIQEIQIGDEIFGPDGKIKKILNIYKGHDNLYEINPKTKREKITVTGEHILYLDKAGEKTNNYRGPDKILEISVNDYIQKTNNFKHLTYLKYNDTILDTKNYNIIPTKLNPYFIGVYLGDGHSHNCAITSIDKEIIDSCAYEANIFNCEFKKQNNSKYGYSFVKKTGKNNPILDEFRKIGLFFGNNKKRLKCKNRFIPHILFNTSPEYRKELLAGLIDTDGHLHKKTFFEYSSKSLNLCMNVRDLAISLGLISHIRKHFNKKYNKMYYRTIIMGNIDIIPTRLIRKKAIRRLSTMNNGIFNSRNQYRSSFDINYIGKGEYYGIQVEDSLYLSHNGLITHNSGKSLTLYLLIRWYNEKTLLIVPTTNLVIQMRQDFIDYGYKGSISIIKSGESKENLGDITVSTFQSLPNVNESFFNQFKVILNDEVHHASAKTIKNIFEKAEKTPVKIGCTGTLDEEKKATDEMLIRGLFGKKFIATTTRELIDRGTVSDIDITCINLEYPEDFRKQIRTRHNKEKITYASEIDILIGSKDGIIQGYPNRQNFIAKLALKITDNKNTLILCRYIRHAQELNDILSNITNKKIFLIYGTVKAEYRDEIRSILEKETNIIVIATYKTLGEGVSINNLHNIIFSSPIKGMIGVLQAIGRALRLHKSKIKARLYDIGDNFSIGKYINFSYQHFTKRIEYYIKGKLDYKILNIKL